MCVNTDYLPLSTAEFNYHDEEVEDGSKKRNREVPNDVALAFLCELPFKSLRAIYCVRVLSPFQTKRA
eukprot:601898-Amphidinium_carterae.1